MGFLRLLFALSVIVVHAYPLWGFQGSSGVAVDSFFVISGFYMALILNEKYIKKNGSYKLFIINRFLRIYPLYWLILGLAFVFTLYKFLAFPGQDSYIKTLLDFLSHSQYFGYEIVMTIWRNISLIFTPDYFRHNFIDPGYLLIQPAWTLQVELIFYLMAPFIVKIRTPFLLVLTVLFSIITFAYKDVVSPHDASLTTIFITRFVFFLFGILSYRLYVLLKKKRFARKISAPTFAIFPLIFLFFGGYVITVIPASTEFQIVSFIYFVFFLLCIPFIFIYSKDKSLDSAIGELSYPVYLCHQLVFKIINNGFLAKQNHELITIMTMVATVIVAYLLTKTIEEPIDKIRQSRLHTR